eukprot:jgi/Undpi1/8819/HiC_scaffold_25.g11281.m1
MGNSSKALRGRGEEANIAVMRSLLDKYEEIKKRSIGGASGPSSQDAEHPGPTPGSGLVQNLSDRQLYSELEQELAMALRLRPSQQRAAAAAQGGEHTGSASSTISDEVVACSSNSSSSSSCCGNVRRARQQNDAVKSTCVNFPLEEGSSSHLAAETRRPQQQQQQQHEHQQRHQHQQHQHQHQQQQQRHQQQHQHHHKQQQKQQQKQHQHQHKQLQQQQQQQPIALVDAPPATRKRMSILVVDDSQITCQLARRALSQVNFHVEVALDGRLGLEALKARPMEFSLVLLDVIMPGIDGFEVLCEMKKHPLLHTIPVAMLSGLQDESLEVMCMQQGAEVVLRKPMKTEEVLRVVQQTYGQVPLPSAATTTALAAAPAGANAKAITNFDANVTLATAPPGLTSTSLPPAQQMSTPPVPPPPTTTAITTTSTAIATTTTAAATATKTTHHRHHRHQMAIYFQEQFTNVKFTRPPLTILVVDDSTISCKLAMRKLRGLGYSTIHADNGQAALGIIKRSPNRVNLILLDIIMPVMNGVQLLHAIKRDRKLQHIPVVILSSLERENLGDACIDSGALAVLQKPLKAQEVEDVIVREGIAPL